MPPCARTSRWRSTDTVKSAFRVKSVSPPSGALSKHRRRRCVPLPEDCTPSRCVTAEQSRAGTASPGRRHRAALARWRRGRRSWASSRPHRRGSPSKRS
eukprot:scaffold19547_cov66-Phaeocystis_antarctica.AAC.3